MVHRLLLYFNWTSLHREYSPFRPSRDSAALWVCALGTFTIYTIRLVCFSLSIPLPNSLYFFIGSQKSFRWFRFVSFRFRLLNIQRHIFHVQDKRKFNNILKTIQKWSGISACFSTSVAYMVHRLLLYFNWTSLHREYSPFRPSTTQNVYYWKINSPYFRG
jgi:hypothetical protein